MKQFTCACGSMFESREEIRKHGKVCSQAQKFISVCSGCLEPSQVLFSYEESELCPLCAIVYEEPTVVLGTLLVNHMGEDYKEIFLEKAGALLEYLDVNKLSDIGIVAVWITFTKEYTELTYHSTPKGELIFLFNKESISNEKIQKIHKETFKHVITHEIFHRYVSEMLELGISSNLKGSFSFLESFSGSLLGDAQLIKIAVSRNIKPLIIDEIKRVNAYYKDIPMVMTNSLWRVLPATAKFNCMMSLTYAYAEASWLSKILKDKDVARQAEENIRLIQPHYVRYGYIKLAKIIREILEEKIAETDQEKEILHRKILLCCDEWADSQNLNLY